MVAVVWSVRARRDRDEIHARWARSAGPAAANAMIARAMRTTDFIARYPEASVIVNDRKDRDRPVPGVPIVVRYRYQPRAQRIRIVRMYHARQDRR